MIVRPFCDVDRDRPGIISGADCMFECIPDAAPRAPNHMMLTNPDRFDKTFKPRNNPLNWDN
jgi:hypothetical protein